jgi:hydroxyacylglutathione hydrolase
MGIFTGDFVFVGSIGRPDLLETAAGITGSAEIGARQLYHSMRKFLELPDHLQIWPAHGAGSACGKGLGAIPSSTVGYERLFNPALQYDDEEQFVDYILTDQPETPFYFAVMKRVNKLGPELLKNLSQVSEIDTKLLAMTAAEHLVIDTIASSEYESAHVPGTINIPSSSLVQWAGFFVDYGKPVYLITEQASLPTILRGLRSIGIDQVGGYFNPEAVQNQGLRVQSYDSVPPKELQTKIAAGEVALVDVRAATEYRAGHIPNAQNHFLGTLLRDLDELPRDRTIVAQCLGGGRSAIAASLLQKEGFDVINMEGGYRAWVNAGLETKCETQLAAL